MCAVPNMDVFCSSLTSRFPGMLLTYFLNGFEIVPVASIITGMTFVFTFHMRYISVVSTLYFRIFSASFLITFLSPEIASIIIIIIIIQYVYLLSQAFLPGTSLEPAVIPTAQASSFTLQYFPYYVWCSKYSCLL